jgi:hypothetical protein
MRKGAVGNNDRVEPAKRRIATVVRRATARELWFWPATVTKNVPSVRALVTLQPELGHPRELYAQSDPSD